MDTEIVETVTEWESQQFSGGYAGLQELARQEFTGAVTDDVSWLFFLNGQVVAAVDGSIDSFAETSGTAYHAPDPSVPLLFAMQEQGGETKAKYYTEETPLSEVDGTLSSGNFTGYVELSENVLSGDYYLVYHGGRSLACAFIGNSRSLLTGDEAFERAADEVGIYEVRDVEIDVIPIPDDGVAAGDDGATADGTDDRATNLDGVGGVGEVEVDGTEADGVEAGERSTTDEAVGATADSSASDDPADTDPESEPATETVGTADSPLDGDPDSSSDTDTDDSIDTDTATQDSIDTDTDTDDSIEADASAGGSTEIDAGIDDSVDVDTAESTRTRDEGSGSADPAGDTVDVSVGGDGDVASATAEVVDTTDGSEESTEREPTDSADPFSKEAQWRETQSIPSLDPSNSEAEAANAPEAEPSSRSATATAESESPPERDPETAALRERLREYEAALEEAEATKEQLAAEREELETERDQHRERADRLQSRVEELESKIERLESQLTAGHDGSEGGGTRTMSSSDALSGTNLFARYDSKGGATLEKAHAGEVDQEAVVENLRLEHHTSFDTDGLQVAGSPFEEFLHGSVEYRFVRWLLTELLAEISRTDHASELGQLYDSIPEIDRAELYGTVSVEYQQDGETHREQDEFDVVLRDRMGNPLIVANLNEDRDPATGDMMTSLIESARRVKDTSESLSSAFLVTTSYFQPSALETAEDATGGGLLGRGKRKSFVKLSRKRGFHLCLVETREGNFHVNVPEL